MVTAKKHLSPAHTLHQQAQEQLQARHWPQAWQSLQLLVAMDAGDAWAQRWRVVVALALGRPHDAVAAANEALAALQLRPLGDALAQARALADVAFNQGQAHGLLGETVAALRAFDQALAWWPQHSGALLGRATACAMLGLVAQSGRAATELLLLPPQTVPAAERCEALSLLANGLLHAGQAEAALQQFMAIEKVRPATAFTACMVVFLHRQLADWSVPQLPCRDGEALVLQKALSAGLRPDLGLLAHRAFRQMPAIEPFAGLVLYDEPQLQRHVAQQWLARLHPPVPGNTNAEAPRRPGPLRLAYVSCEFNEHATSYLLAGVLARHNPERVAVFLLSFSPPPASGQPDAMQQRIRSMGHTWVDIHTWSDAQVAQWCREQGMDVVVDLKGLTRHNRAGIFAHRAAPVQVNWLGYPGTMPAPYFDWVLADAQVLPPELEPHFGERVWRLPHSYQPNDPDRAVDPTPQTRAQHGLPEEGPVLVCFNNSFKITPEVWAVWMRLLQVRPDAVLWLLAGSQTLQRNLRDHAQAAGVDPQRLVFAPTLAHEQHLARLALADLSLDTMPYNAHTTASDALWAGVPHVACTGQSFAARVGASVLTAAGMPELIAYGLVNYEALAKRLLLCDAERAALRQKLIHQCRTAPLWDAQGFARALEDAFSTMAFGELPAVFRLPRVDGKH